MPEVRNDVWKNLIIYKFIYPRVEVYDLKEMTALLRGTIDESQVDPRQLIMGQFVEKEHTSNPEAAKAIALHHLGEIKDYYSRLIEMKVEAERPLEWTRGSGESPDCKLAGLKTLNNLDFIINKVGERNVDYFDELIKDFDFLEQSCGDSSGRFRELERIGDEFTKKDAERWFDNLAATL